MIGFVEVTKGMDSFRPFLFFIAIIFFSFEPSRSTDNCVTHCGSQRIRFPFSLTGQPQHCGYHGFSLSCQLKEMMAQQLPTLTLPYLGNFSVFQIDYAKQVLQLRYSQGCLPSILLRGLDLSGGPFKPTFTQTYTFYHCLTNETLVLYAGVVRIPCLSGSNYDVLAVPTDVDIPSTSICTEMAKVSVPLSVTDWSHDIITLGWTDPDCLLDNVTAGLQGGSHHKKGISASVTYGLVFGLGIPLVFILAVLSCIKINLTERQNYLDSDTLMTSVTGSGLPQSTPAAANGLGRQTIKAFPTTTLVPSRLLPNPSESVCCICLCQYQANEKLKAIPKCNHYFHVDCIDQWLKLNATCPICRDKFEEPASLDLSSARPVAGLSF